MLGEKSLLGAALLLLACPGEPERFGRAPTAAASTTEVITGQWIWTATDGERFSRADERARGLVPGILVGTVFPAADGALLLRRGLSPAGTAGPSVALVVRVDDGVRRVGATELLPLVRSVLDDARRTGVSVRELQLDYDCPERRLEEWARAAGEVAASVDVPVWVTSIPSHLEQRRYGELFRGRVAGHVLQLFDTGLRCSQGNARHVAERVAAAGMPFRVGVAAFERVGRASEHACWRRAGRELRDVAGHSGQWVFPGGEDVRVALAELGR